MIQARTNPPEAARVDTIPRNRVSDFEQWRIVTLHQLGHYLRTNRFYGLVGFVALISALTLAGQVDAGIAAVQVQQLYRSSEYLSNGLMYTGLWVILAAAFFGGDALSETKRNWEGYQVQVRTRTPKGAAS